MTSQKADETYSEEETVARCKATFMAMLATKPKPQKASDKRAKPENAK